MSGYAWWLPGTYLLILGGACGTVIELGFYLSGLWRFLCGLNELFYGKKCTIGIDLETTH